MTRSATSARAVLERALAAVEAKNLPAALALFAEDAVLEDPHYPNPRMQGKATVAEGLRWAFGTLDRMGFAVVAALESEDGQSVAVEVATSHTMKGGAKLEFPQAFFVDTKDGQITRLRAYSPHGPNGIGGLVLGAVRLSRQLTARR